jgi:hypothetical protein
MGFGGVTLDEISTWKEKIHKGLEKILVLGRWLIFRQFSSNKAQGL